MPLTVVTQRPVTTNGKVMLLAIAAISNLAAPTVTELATGVEFECATNNFDPTSAISKQSTTSKDVLCDTKATSKTAPEQLGALDLHVWVDPQAATNALLTLLAGEATGYIVEREGIDYGTAIAAAQKVNVYQYVVNGDPIPDAKTTDDDNSFGATVQLLLKDRRYGVALVTATTTTTTTI